MIISCVMPGGCANAAPQSASRAVAEPMAVLVMERLPRSWMVVATIVTRRPSDGKGGAPYE